MDPRTYLRPQARGAERKTLQLCRQVQRTLELTLGDFGDEILGSLLVEQVLPAPNAGQLMVVVRPLSGADLTDVGEVLVRLTRVTPQLRHAVARAISRRKTPQLLFRVSTLPHTGDGTQDGV